MALEALELETKEARQTLKSLNGSIETSKKELSKLDKKAEERTVELSETIRSLEDKKAVLQEVNSTLSAHNLELESTNTVLNTAIDALSLTRNSLLSDNSTFEGQQKALTEEKESLETEIIDLNIEKATLIEVSEAKKEELDREIEHLSLTREGIAQEIIDSQEEQERAKSALADWHRDLGEKDQNLRVREEKLKQREKVIIRNSQLLKL